MFYRLLFLQMIAQLTSATPRDASLVDKNHAQPDMIQDTDLGAENQAELFSESIQSMGEGNSNGLIIDKTPFPRGNIAARSSANEGQPAVCSNPETVRDCGTTITQSGTILRSPITSNSTLLYPASTDCTWNVEAPVAMNITVVTLCEFATASSTQSTSNCSEDYIEFKPSDGRDVTICGAYDSFSYKTPVNLLTIRFRSDSDSKVGIGFVIRIDFVKEDLPEVCYDHQTVRDCETTITQSGTILRSPITSNSNLLYPASTVCAWNVEAPVGMNISVVSLCEFGTSSTTQSTSKCTEDYMEFKPSDGRDSILCGGYSSFSYNTSNLLAIRFRSNSDNKVGRGFVIRIDFVKEDQPDICYDPQTFLDCGATITKSDTILRSPIKSSNNLLYPVSTTCEWNVKAPPGSDIHVVSLCKFGTAPLTDRSLCFDDYLEFVPGNGRRYTFCGGFTSFSFNTTGGGNKLSIRFRSDSDDKVGRGFAAKIIFSSGIGMFCCGPLLMTLTVVTYAVISV